MLLSLALKVAPFFELDGRKAAATAAQVGQAVDSWALEAHNIGISKGEIDRMASAFEHDDLQAVRRMTAGRN